MTYDRILRATGRAIMNVIVLTIFIGLMLVFVFVFLFMQQNGLSGERAALLPFAEEKPAKAKPAPDQTESSELV